MSIAVRSFAKINLGLKIGPRRADGYHELRTVYQTLALHDIVHVELRPGSGIEIRCNDPRVPLDHSNTCYKVAELVLRAVEDGNSNAGADETEAPQGLKPSREAVLDGTAKAVPFQNHEHLPNHEQLQNQEHLQKNPHPYPAQSQLPDQTQDQSQSRLRNQARVQGQDQFQAQNRYDQKSRTPRTANVIIEIDKRLPVQGGMGAGSSNAVATMLGLERALATKISAEEKMRIATEVGSDVPLFLIGGTVLGIGHGEEVYPLPDMPRTHMVVVTPPIAVSTPKAFAQWDDLVAREPALTGAGATSTINRFSRAVDAWLSECFLAGRIREGNCIRCSRGGRGPGRDTASRPRPSRDRERLRTRRLSRVSRFA